MSGSQKRQRSINFGFTLNFIPAVLSGSSALCGWVQTYSETSVEDLSTL